MCAVCQLYMSQGNVLLKCYPYWCYTVIIYGCVTVSLSWRFTTPKLINSSKCFYLYAMLNVQATLIIPNKSTMVEKLEEQFQVHLLKPYSFSPYIIILNYFLVSFFCFFSVLVSLLPCYRVLISFFLYLVCHTLKLLFGDVVTQCLITNRLITCMLTVLII